MFTESTTTSSSSSVKLSDACLEILDEAHYRIGLLSSKDEQTDHINLLKDVISCLSSDNQNSLLHGTNEAMCKRNHSVNERLDSLISMVQHERNDHAKTFWSLMVSKCNRASGLHIANDCLFFVISMLHMNVINITTPLGFILSSSRCIVLVITNNEIINIEMISLITDICWSTSGTQHEQSMDEKISVPKEKYGHQSVPSSFQMMWLQHLRPSEERCAKCWTHIRLLRHMTSTVLDKRCDAQLLESSVWSQDVCVCLNCP